MKEVWDEVDFFMQINIKVLHGSNYVLPKLCKNEKMKVKKKISTWKAESN